MFVNKSNFVVISGSWEPSDVTQTHVFVPCSSVGQLEMQTKTSSGRISRTVYFVIGEHSFWIKHV